MKIRIQLLNIVLFELIMALLLFLFGKLKTALRCQTILFMIIGLANYYVLEFRSAPIMPWDILSIGTAASVANNFKYTLSKETVFVLIGFVILILLESKVTLELKKDWRIRVGGVLASFALLWGFTAMLHQDSTVARFKLYDKLFTPTVMSKRDGTAVAFLMELKYIVVEKPDGYNKEDAAALLASYDTNDTESATHTPNIIVIMNEAFSDLSVLGDFETNEDYMPFLHSLMQEGTPNTISGHLNVSVLGGNTANTEFEFLTGNTMAFLPQGSVAYQQYVKSNDYSIATYLKSKGYDTIAMHPYNASGWDRDKVYPLLGFDTFYSLKDWVNPVKIRKYVSDQSCYDKIIELYEQKDANTPFFLFNVTMQNHSSYSEEYDNFHPDITVEGTSSKILPNYLSLIKLSDQALCNLIEYFSKADEDTVIVFFGDHQPSNSVAAPVWKLNGRSGDSLTEEEEARRYKVPFIIWANYDIEAASNVETSANYLGSHVLRAAGLPLYDYRNYLSQLEEQYPVLTAIRAENAQGISTPVKDVKSTLQDYMILQYYNIFSQK
jgi:phosphoglycerol transferase MdoB-like AlkP superfamily enzyme